MALHSRFLSADPRLQAALVSDAEHILLGSVGAHVVRIQSALNLLDRAIISATELQRGLYGSSTAAAVLTYKRKRNIVNRAYQSKADNIVGKMTIARLDREMLLLESKPHSLCTCSPKDGAHLLLGFALAGANTNTNNTPAPAPGVFPPPPPTHTPIAIQNAPAGIKLAQGALDALTVILDPKFPSANLPANVAFQALQVHYRSTTADFAATGRQLILNLQAVIDVLKNAASIFTPGVPGDPDGDNSYAYSRNPRDGKIYVKPEFLKVAVSARGFVLLHEAFHALSERFVDIGKDPDDDGARNYRQIPKDLLPISAHSFSQCVLQIKLGARKTMDVETGLVADWAP
jgi:hypothetical protein